MTTNDANNKDITDMLNVADAKSFGSLMLFLYDRWEEEKGIEEFDGYKNYLKNVLRKYTPKSTKLIDFTAEPFCCKLHLQPLNKQFNIEVKARKLEYTLT